eukprot:CAMPEP_0197621884 /NCGR_PEP_ID=MMETSP1338-20131121/2316_1 /TAXON_ID=43686 ORGANISM="Pelagodinium beii, Strain RCC1491" /NCGR_SAMPLE_ID=MMETSP1338 /ASSEMBLY_ACC=CAM_ASM_000754 /LENGTH=258 /DNA_ID=CAMNT_0043191455 /DNA_START=67 /DNA_END=843 /DNA_ORIENTATION=+
MALGHFALALLFMSLGGSASCTDENQYCSTWAAEGECHQNPGYMLFSCAKSCGKCGGESSTSSAASTTIHATSAIASTIITSSSPDAEVASTSVAATTSHGEQCGAFDNELDNKDLAGTLLLTWQAPSMDGCCAKCGQTTGCEGFSYVYGTCYLKGSLSGTYAQQDVKTRLRTVLGECSGFGAEQPDVDLAGQLVEQVFAANSDVCCSACRANSQCQGFSYFEQFCYLKTALQGTYSKTGCAVQIKKGDRRLSLEMIV